MVSQPFSISLKDVVMKALSEGKPMSEIRLAANKAAQDVTGKQILPTAATVDDSAPTTALVNTAQTAVQPAGIVANPAEVSLDPETGKMMATLLPGESIFRMAQRVYGKENGRQYLEIYAANRDKIKDINIVVEGLVLVMP